uniref:Uncharacterized protein n=1 Tax=Mycena chlorophos TaxID=658473 RepID=A0ABQ0KXR8_MYCCL|nr:predicted protein [Mycena chlorophos]
MEPATIGTLISGIKGTIDITIAALRARDEAKANEMANAINDQLAKLYGALFDAQQNALASQERIQTLVNEASALKSELDEFMRKRIELEKYELTPVSEGPVLYRLKVSNASEKPAHYRCPSCVDAGKPGYLQPATKGLRMYLICPDCRFEYAAGFLPPPDYSKLIERMA